MSQDYVIFREPQPSAPPDAKAAMYIKYAALKPLVLLGHVLKGRQGEWRFDSSGSPTQPLVRDMCGMATVIQEWIANGAVTQEEETK